MTIKPGIIYLQRDSFQVYSPLLPNILEFRFVPEIIRDLDVINKDLLENLIQLFITNSKIVPGPMDIVIGDNAAFIKDFMAAAPPPLQPGQTSQPIQHITDEMKVEADKFIEHVPFESVVSKTLPWNNGLRVFAVNEELYGDIKNSFEKNGFSIDTVIPAYLLGNAINANHILDIPTASVLPEKINGIRQNNLLIKQDHQFEGKVKKEFEAEVEEIEHKTVEMGMPQGKEKKRLFVMIGVFGVLIVILVIVYFQSLTPPPTPANSTTLPQPAALPPDQANNIPQPQVATDPIATVAPTVSVKNLTVQIINTPASVRSAQTLKTQLDTFGFKSVQVQNQTTTGAAQSIITFSANPSPEIKASVLAEVRQIVGEVTVQEKQDSLIDIGIVLAK